MNGNPINSTAARQQRVHTAIQNVGGYWRPIAGVARLLEELGELGELLESTEDEAALANLAEELADIWIISTCTANQFNINLDSYYPKDTTLLSSGNSFYDAVSHAGRVARIVNYYDGPKNPRTFDQWPTLGPAIADLHTAVYRLASQYEITLDQVVDEKVSKIINIDRGRYSQSYDPSTAASLDHFRPVRNGTACPYANEAKLWGGPPWEPNWSVKQNVASLLPFLVTFTKAAPHEALDGFVIAVDESVITKDMSVLADWFCELLVTLAQNDPKPTTLYDGNIGQPGWQFSFNGLRLFIAVFSPLYPLGHVRHSDAGTFVMLQPEISFDHHGIGSKFPGSFKIKEDVRQLFTDNGVPYPSSVIDTRNEACIYLLPRWDGDPQVVWWHDLSGRSFSDPSDAV